MLAAFAGGTAGAVALNLIHETARRAIPDAPRMDVLGMRAIVKMFGAAGSEPPDEPELRELALIGDLVSNAAYYSLAGVGSADGAPARGALLGLVAGVGALVLPGPLGLGTAPSRRTPATALMTVAWYTLGGLVAGAVCQQLGADDR